MRHAAVLLAACLALAPPGCGPAAAGGGSAGDGGAGHDGGGVTGGGAPDGGATDGGAVADGGTADGGAPTDGGTTDGGTPAPFWVSAYLTSWSQLAGDTDGDGNACGNWGLLTSSDIDWSAFTDLLYFAISANADGSITKPQCWHNISADRLLDIVPAAHAHGRPILITVGGAGDTGFGQAIAAAATRKTLVDNLVAFVKTWHFDGVDVDLEPFTQADEPGFVAFSDALHAALAPLTVPGAAHALMTTAAVSGRAEVYPKVASDYDQVNLMTYDLGGLYLGWPVWHNNPVYAGTGTSLGGGKPAGSVDGETRATLASGLPPSKLGVGIDFYGYVWANVIAADPAARTCTGQGITTPGVFWSYYDASGNLVNCTAPSTSAQHVIDNVPYHSILKYLVYASPTWDPAAEATYLSIPQTVIALDMNGNGSTGDGIVGGLDRGYEGNGQGTPEDLFVSYDDPRAVKAIVAYAKQQHLGGVMLWDLGGGWLPQGDPADPTGPKDPLLQAAREAAAAP